ncbi:MAG: putative DNA-binding protein [Alkaliphilus sp.]
MLEKKVEFSLMLDFYGKLLTDKQLEIMDLYYNQDLSLTEIAENLKITRQAVHDTIKKTEKSLVEYEKKLNLCEKFGVQIRLLKKIQSIADDGVRILKKNNSNKEDVDNYLEKVYDLIEYTKELEGSSEQTESL